ncbi:MAG: cysteine desulfurase family protein [Minisyncoccota bacterium]
MDISKIFKKKNRRVFLDYASATPIRREVRSVMRFYADENFTNPSALYIEARKAKESLLLARKDVASVLNTTASQIVFTSGGTEANNIALLGVFEKARINGVSNPHIVSVATEHPAILEVLKEVERRGGEVTYLSTREDGLISAQQVSDVIKENTVLVSVMYVNNEIGVVQPIKDITQIIKLKNKERALKIVFHTDACQAPLWYGLDVSTLGVDLLTLDGLKIGGPRGVGCLYVKGGTEISPVMWGGGQENGLRSGTESVGSCLGFAKALVISKNERKELGEKVQKLRDGLWNKIQVSFPSAKINGSLKHRAPNNLNVCFENIDAEYLTVALDTYGVCVSYSSSCRTLKEDSTSYVIEALDPKCKGSSIRFTLGKENTQSDIDFTIEALKKALIQVTRS